jgi:ABC-type sugar transport system substrate-binding protein
MRDGIQETAASNGISVVILNTDDDQTPEAQLNICLTSITRRPRVIVMGAATKNVGIECFKKAAAAGITVADVDGNVSIEEAKEAGVNLAFTVTSDNVAIGRQAAEHLATIKNSDSPKILVIRGLPGNIVSEQRANGFLERLKVLLPAARIVGTPTADWDRMKAMNTTLDFMQREGDIDFIFSVSDVMTTGVVEALKVSKKRQSCRVVSVDGIADARKAILDGGIAADVAQLPYLMGKRAVELAYKTSREALGGVTEYTATPLLTQETLERAENPELAFLK